MFDNKKKTFVAVTTAFMLALVGSFASAAPVYLNYQNMTVALGSSHDDDVANNPTNGPFFNVSIANSLANIIDAPSANAGEFHSQSTHVWATAPLELVFDLQTDYDIFNLHFWNYHSFGWEVASIELIFLDASSSTVGTYLANPHLGGTSDANNNDSTEIFAQNFDLSGQGLTEVRYVNATLFGGSIRPNEVDFQNIGFTGLLSEGGVAPPPSTTVNEPAAFLMTLAALFALVFMRRRFLPVCAESPPIRRQS